jgi:hypothetical protein
MSRKLGSLIGLCMNLNLPVIVEALVIRILAGIGS